MCEMYFYFMIINNKTKTISPISDNIVQLRNDFSQMYWS